VESLNEYKQEIIYLLMVLADVELMLSTICVQRANTQPGFPHEPRDRTNDPHDQQALMNHDAGGGRGYPPPT